MRSKNPRTIPFHSVCMYDTCLYMSMSLSVSVTNVCFQCIELLCVSLNWCHTCQGKGTEVCVEGIDWIPLVVCMNTGGDEFGSDFLIALVRFSSRSRCRVYHVAKGIHQFEFLKAYINKQAGFWSVVASTAPSSKSLYR